MIDIFDSPVGKILVEADDNVIVQISFTNNQIATNPNYLCNEAKRQITAYFNGELTKFDLPIFVNGTDFQRKVWKATSKIPFASIKTYKEIAIDIGKPKSYRAVGNALGKNPIPLIIPCHRVVSQNGLGGFSAPFEIKRYLLEWEKNKSNMPIYYIKNYLLD